MKTRLSKVLLLFCAVAALHLAEACWFNGLNCNCDDVLPHFDYQNVTAQISNPATDHVLQMSFLPADVEFLANAGLQERGFGLNTTALACDCISDGGRWRQIPVSTIYDHG